MEYLYSLPPLGHWRSGLMLQSCERNATSPHRPRVYLVAKQRHYRGGSDKKPRKEKKGFLKKSQFKIRVL